MMEQNEIRKKLKKTLDKERYEHTKGVMYTAGCLAMANRYPIEKAMFAGLYMTVQSVCQRLRKSDCVKIIIF